MLTKKKTNNTKLFSDTIDDKKSNMFSDLVDNKTGGELSLKEQLSSFINTVNDAELQNKEIKYLSRQAPNIVEWVSGLDYWGVPTLFKFTRQYEILRDFFDLRCTFCNPQDPESKTAWGKSRDYLESENLFVWDQDEDDFRCPKCRKTQKELIEDGLMVPKNEIICIAGMRSGKTNMAAMVAGYTEHILRVLSMNGRGYLQKYFGQQPSQVFDVTFAASTATQAQDTVFGTYRSMRMNSPWIKRHEDYVVDRYKEQQHRADPWRYGIAQDEISDGWLMTRFSIVASDSAGVRGRTRIFATIDEWAHLIDTDGPRSAAELYAVLNQSLLTVRTSVETNRLHRAFGLMVNATSPASWDDPAMIHYNRAATGELPRTFYWKGATWEFNPVYTKDSSDILDAYLKDPVKAERDFGANPPLAASPFIDNPKLFMKSIDIGRKPIIEFENCYVEDKLGTSYKGVKVTKCLFDNQAIPRHIFMDSGLTRDAFAFAVGHIEVRDVGDVLVSNNYVGLNFDQEEIEELERMDEDLKNESYGRPFGGGEGNTIGSSYSDNGMIHISKMPGMVPLSGGNMYNNDKGINEAYVCVIDGICRIVPEIGKEVWYESIMNIISDIKNRLSVASVSCDRWNSAEQLQRIRNMGIPASPIMLKPDDFMRFLSLAYSGKVRMLPSDEKDKLMLLETGALSICSSWEDLGDSSAVIIELLKLNRDNTLRKFYNPNKGKVRGHDSDDMARCVVGLVKVLNDVITNKEQEKHAQKMKSARNVSINSNIFRTNSFKKSH
jgi:hypothetical protein